MRRCRARVGIRLLWRKPGIGASREKLRRWKSAEWPTEIGKQERPLKRQFQGRRGQPFFGQRKAEWSPELGSLQPSRQASQSKIPQRKHQIASSKALHKRKFQDQPSTNFTANALRCKLVTVHLVQGYKATSKSHCVTVGTELSRGRVPKRAL